MSLFYAFINRKRIFFSDSSIAKASHVHTCLNGFSAGLLLFILLICTAEVGANNMSKTPTDLKVSGANATRSKEVVKDADLAVSQTMESLKQIQYYTRECTRSITRLQKAHMRSKRVSRRLKAFLQQSQSKNIPQDVIDKATKASAAAKASLDIIELDILQVIYHAYQVTSTYNDDVQLKSVEVLSKAREISKYADSDVGNANKLTEMEKLLLETKNITELARNDTLLVEGFVKNSTKLAFVSERMAFRLENARTEVEEALSEE